MTSKKSVAAEDEFYAKFDDMDYKPRVTSANNSSALVSMLLSFLSNLRWGVDLVSMASPSFLLSGKSLLEANADYMRPTNQLLRIASEKDAALRALSVLRWILVPMSCVPRNGFEQLKPYNPILGEQFKCRWEHDDSTSEFYAEQVSHHPPISAMHFANDKAHLTCSVTMQPKASFWGNSVQVELLGETLVTIVNLDEQYKVRMPNMKGKGIIFGSARYEPAGNMTITCAKTNMTVCIDFQDYCQCEGYLSHGANKLYKISGHIQKKICVTNLQTSHVDANWINISQEVPLMKQVEPFSTQADNESRRVWHGVTQAVLKQDYEKANSAKSAIEEAQRKLAKNTTKPFVPSLFAPTGNKSEHGVPIYQYIHQKQYCEEIEEEDDKLMLELD